MFTVTMFFKQYLKIHPEDELTARDWLIFSEHKLKNIKEGKLFHDDLAQQNTTKVGLLSTRYLVVLPSIIMARALGKWGDVEDKLGSKIIASRLVRDLIRLCFLIEETYAPHSKWFGTAFFRLRCAEKLTPIFHRELSA